MILLTKLQTGDVQ